VCVCIYIFSPFFGWVRFFPFMDSFFGFIRFDQALSFFQIRERRHFCVCVSHYPSFVSYS
jgi:hypothetical protein